MYIRNRIKSWVCRASVDLMEKIHLQCFNLCRSVCSRCCAHASMSSEFLKKEKTLNFDSNERNYVIETIRWSGVLHFSIVNNAPKWSKIESIPISNGVLVISKNKCYYKNLFMINMWLLESAKSETQILGPYQFLDLIRFLKIKCRCFISFESVVQHKTIPNNKSTNRKKKHFTFNGLILVYKSHSRSPTTHKHSFTMRWCLIFVSFASVSFVLFSWRIVFIFV